MSEHYVYVLECDDGTYYTGYTTDVERRVAEHDAGEGAKYTRGRTPVSLVYAQGHESRSAAMSREAEIKSLARTEKERLVADGDRIGEDGDHIGEDGDRIVEDGERA